jgi:hypothetical protein
MNRLPAEFLSSKQSLPWSADTQDENVRAVDDEQQSVTLAAPRLEEQLANGQHESKPFGTTGAGLGAGFQSHGGIKIGLVPRRGAYRRPLA